MVVMSDGELVFDSEEETSEMDTTSKEDNMHANYPILTQGGRDNK